MGAKSSHAHFWLFAARLEPRPSEIVWNWPATLDTVHRAART